MAKVKIDHDEEDRLNWLITFRFNNMLFKTDYGRTTKDSAIKTANAIAVFLPDDVTVEVWNMPGRDR